MTDFELRIVTVTVLMEARGEGRKGMAAVAHVIKTRCGRRKLSPVNVCLEPLQFSSWNHDNKDRGFWLMDESDAFRKAQCIVSDVFSGQYPDITKGADHFFNPDLADPGWQHTMLKTAEIGNHWFFDSTRVSE